MRNAREKPVATHPGYRDLVLPRLTHHPVDLAQAIRPHAIPFPSAKANDWLRDFVQGIRVVGIGDGSHGTLEFFSVQETLARQLIMHHGVRLVLLEVPAPFCFLVNQGLTSKHEEEIEKLVSLTCRFDTWTNPPILRLLRFIGGWNRQYQRDQVSVRGIDPQLGGSLERLKAFLYPNMPHVDEIGTWSRDISCLYVGSANENSGSNTRALRRDIRSSCRKLLSRGHELLSRCVEQELLHYLIRSTCLELAFQVRALGRDGLGRSDTRDKYMAASVLKELHELEDQRRAVVIAHNSHISFGAPDIFSNGMGQFLRRALNEGAYKVIVSTSASGTVTSRATDTSIARELFVSDPAPTESLEGILKLAVEGPSVIDMASGMKNPLLASFFSSPIAFRSMGCVVCQREFWPLRPTDQFDAIVFFPESHGLE